MVKQFLTVFLISQTLFFAQTGIAFNDYFEESTLRIDFIFNSCFAEDEIRIEHLYKYDCYAGARSNLIDTVDLGKYFLKVYDNSGELIYSRGFTGLVSEYKITQPGINGIKKEFQQVLLIPFPKIKVAIVIEGRTRTNNFEKLYSSKFDPDASLIESTDYNGTVEYGIFLDNGNPQNKADLVFVGEGYSSKPEFVEDVKRFSNALLEQAPFKSSKDKINIHYAYALPSEDNGNIILEGSNLKTAANTNFNTLGMKGYLGTEDIHSLYDITCGVPCDHLIVLVKSDRFGGNGIYNHFCMTTTDHPNSEKVFLHEFGHSFGGLADEYYEDFYSGLKAEFYYPQDVEPLEPNITINSDKETIKWKRLLTEGIHIPTKWNKEKLDSMQIALIKKQIAIEEKLNKTSADDVDNGSLGEKRSSIFAMLKDGADEFKHLYNIEKEKFENVVGAFEGAAHFVKGFYRPSFICIMNKTGYHKFCAVCQNAFQKAINYYSD